MGWPKNNANGVRIIQLENLAKKSSVLNGLIQNGRFNSRFQMEGLAERIGITRQVMSDIEIRNYHHRKTVSGILLQKHV